ncbi:winged helix-turn-helix domain-containing protein [Clostridium butyricum]
MNDLYMGIENEIIDKLLYDINNGVYNENEKMPSENDLASKYEISRIKVRNIYKKLEKMGYLYSLQGRGRFLKRRTKTIELVLSGNESFSKKLKEMDLNLKQ